MREESGEGISLMDGWMEWMGWMNGWKGGRAAGWMVTDMGVERRLRAARNLHICAAEHVAAGGWAAVFVSLFVCFVCGPGPSGMCVSESRFIMVILYLCFVYLYVYLVIL